MIRIVALSLSYLVLLFAFAAGIEALLGRDCSDWLPNCVDEQTQPAHLPDGAETSPRPEAPGLQ